MTATTSSRKPVDAIRCEGLTKRFRSRLALDHLDLTVHEGEVFGFLGPNGAGKTTTIRLLLGLLRATGGRAWLLGEPVPCPARLGQVGAMIEEPAFYPWMSGRRNLQTLLDHGSPGPPAAVEDVLDRLSMRPVADQPVKTYSQGMRQRLGLGAALLRRPRLLLLDEPANGLDPAGMRDLRALLRELGDGGTTVFLSSHLLGEVEQVCDRVAMLDRGRLVASGTVAQLTLDTERVRLVVRPVDEAAAALLLDRFDLRRDGPGRFLVATSSAREVNRILALGGVYAESVAVERIGLEESFMAAIGLERDRASAQG